MIVAKIFKNNKTIFISRYFINHQSYIYIYIYRYIYLICLIDCLTISFKMLGFSLYDLRLLWHWKSLILYVCLLYLREYPPKHLTSISLAFIFSPDRDIILPFTHVSLKKLFCSMFKCPLWGGECEWNLWFAREGIGVLWSFLSGIDMEQSFKP